MSTPAISVIVPVYNVERYLEECIGSILGQTFQNFELILVDDGSRDRSPAICDAYAKQDSRVKVIHQVNSGVSAARNAGINAAQGVYITFIDSDDYVESTFFQKAYIQAAENDLDLYISGLIMDTWADGKIVDTIRYTNVCASCYTTKTLLEAAFSDFNQVCICGPCCKLFRRDIISKNQVRFDTELSLGEDTCFNMDFIRKADKIFFDDCIFYHYRKENTQSLTTKFRRDLLSVYRYVYGKMYDLMIEKKCAKAAVQTLNRNRVDMWISCITKYFVFYDQTTKEEKKAIIRDVAQDPLIRKYPLFGLNNRSKVLFVPCLKLGPVGWWFLYLYLRRTYRH